MDELKKETKELTNYELGLIYQLRESIISGKHWYIALLETIGRWQKAEEIIGDRVYRYLIDGEAFDWMLLAERLCLSITDLVPMGDMEDLLFFGQAPINLTNEEFQQLIGIDQYRRYLNFFYGVTVEEALLLAVEDEVAKERHAAVWMARDNNYTSEAFLRIYDAGQMDLLRSFRESKGYPHQEAMSLTEMKEFTYWLFKYRLEHCDRSRVASDTKKAMEYLKKQYIGVLRAKESRIERGD